MSVEAPSNNNSETPLFSNIKYKPSGAIPDEVTNILREGGAEGSNYFSDYHTHCIIGDDPTDTDIIDAKDLYEIPAVSVDWVLLSKKCGKLLPTKPFLVAETSNVFTGINACVSQVGKEDCTMLWAMITFHGGTFTLALNNKVTHLIAGKAEGAKYNHLMSLEKCNTRIVTPDWVIACITQKSKVDETSYHPRLIYVPQIEKKVTDLSSSFSTAHITGFADDEPVSKDEQATPKFSNELLEQLKQRMPWNQISSASSTPTSTTQNFTSPITGLEIKEEPKLVITPSPAPTPMPTMQPLSQNIIQMQSKPQTIIQSAHLQQKTQIILQQQQQRLTQQPMQVTQTWRASPQQIQQTQQHIIHQQQQQQQQLQSQQQTLGQPQGLLLSPQAQHDGQQFITNQGQQIIGRTQQIVHQQPKAAVAQQQFIVREAPPHLVQQQYAEKPQTQFQTWQQQQQYTQNRQQIINAPQVQPRQITWMQQAPGQGAPARQYIQMDAQTHAQLQLMDPQQRTMFLQRLQKQRQLQLQRAMQQPNRGVIEQGQVQFGVLRANPPQTPQPQQQTAVIRGQIPPQHQLQWLQQQRQSQIVIQNRQVLVQQPQPQQAGIIRAPPLQAVQHQRLPVNVVSQTNQQQWQQESNIPTVTQQTVSPAQQQQILNLRQQQQQLQLQRLQQLQLQKQQQQAAAAAVAPPQRIPIYTSQGNLQTATPQPSVLIPQHQEQPDPTNNDIFGVNGQQQSSQQLVVNAKTKTALANMLSIRLQAGTGAPDGTAAGQLRMMNAQHQAPLPPPPPPQVASLPFQRTTLTNVNSNVGIRTPDLGPSPGMTKPTAYAHAQTAARVAAVLAKSASATPPANQHHRPQFYGHSPNLKLPADMFLLGCVFLIMEYDRSGFDVTMWRRIILENGGETELTYSLRVTHIVCQTQKHPLVQQGLRDGKRCVTAEWLSDIVIKQQVLPPWLALHFPTPFSDEKPCRNMIISHSGFEGEERVRVKKMIEAVGAKMTSYYTSHNNILVCKRPEGEKYKKAREWGRSVVNVQWLNEVLFGHYSCLQHPENHKYQQFNIGNPFRIDYTLVPHLMGAWKVPIQVTQDCYDRAKSSGIIGPKRKRPRVSSPTNMGGIEQENMFPIESTLPPIGMPKAIVMFSGPTVNPSDGEKKVLHLGGILAKNCREVTHLVVYSLQRTLKVMCCLSTCKYIVTANWLNDSFNSGQFLDEQPYVLDDPEFEKKHNCNLMKILSNPDRSRLFAGKVFYITPGVSPSRAALTEMVLCAGGMVEKQRKSLKHIQELDSNSYIIVTVQNDFHLVSDVIRANIGIYGAEFIMSAILTQRLPYETAFRKNNPKKPL